MLHKLPMLNNSNKIQTHKRFKRMLFLRIKHNMQTFTAILFIKLQNDRQQLYSEKKDEPYISVFGLAMLLSCFAVRYMFSDSNTTHHAPSRSERTCQPSDRTWPEGATGLSAHPMTVAPACP